METTTPTCKESLQVGNAAKMREALLESRKAMDEVSKSIFQGWIDDGLADFVGEAQRAISSALSTPPRNCDVGTAEEQAKRRRVFCDKHKDENNGCLYCHRCPLRNEINCSISWSQMPYETVKTNKTKTNKGE